MRVVGAATLFVIVALSGCSSGPGGLDTYLMQPHEVPATCGLLPMSSEELQEAKEDAGLTSNPGSIDNRIFSETEDGSDVIGNRVALYECGDSGEVDIASIVIQFRTNATQEDEFEEEFDDCEFGPFAERIVYKDGIIAFVEPEDDVEGMMESMEQWAARVVAQTGATDPCAADGGAGTGGGPDQ